MSTERDTLLELANREYKAGFVTDIESDKAPNVAVNQDLMNDSVSAGTATSTGAARDVVAATSRVTRASVACATFVGRGCERPPTFLRYQQRCFVVWLIR